jgi:hypothetical protein
MPPVRRPPAVLVCCAVLAAGAATGASSAAVRAGRVARVDVLRVAPAVLGRLRRATRVPIRIPRTVYFSTVSRVYATGTGSAGAYDLELGFVPGCGGATACFAADFEGRRGGRVFGRDGVRLAGGIVGRFTPGSCGASCAPPEIQWVEHGAAYSLQLYGGRGGSDEAALIGYADSAIDHRAL